MVDTGNNLVQKFNSSGTWSLQWGGVGTGNGLFSNPTGIAIDGSNNVYVVDSGNNRVQNLIQAVIIKGNGVVMDQVLGNLINLTE